jgi:DNA-binding Xre family transcriptional regulator
MILRVSACLPDQGTLIFHGMPLSKKKISQGRLYPKALKLARGLTLEELYQKTGLPLSWLRKFRQGEIKSPSVQRVEALLVALGHQVG